MLEATFLRFATYMAEWQPPGRGGRGVCGFCNGTYKFIADAPVIRDLPHDLRHDLAWALHVEYNRAYEARVDQEEAERAIIDMDDFDLPDQRQERLVELAQRLEEDMLDAIDAHLDELEYARITFIEPKIEAYARLVVGDVL